MLRTLLISIRFHEGRYYGTGDWPPSPFRLFQALVAGAALGNQFDPDFKNALEWFECLPPPRIVSPPARRGKHFEIFVPNNDLDAKGGNPANVRDIRVPKSFRPWFFDPSLPLIYSWDDVDDSSSEILSVRDITQRLYQLGRGSDMAWATAEILDRNKAESLLNEHPGVIRVPSKAGNVPCPVRNSLRSLIKRHQTKRFIQKDGKILFVQPPKAVFKQFGYNSPLQSLHFEIRDETGFTPHPTRSAALLITGLRNSAAKKLAEALPSKSNLVERILVGLGAGTADLPQRVRIVPIPSVGTRYTDSLIRRIMIEVPPECPISADDILWSFNGLKPHNPVTGESWHGRLFPTENHNIANLYKESSSLFRSVTAVALPKAQRRRLSPATRETKSGNERSKEEMSAVNAVNQALRHAGINDIPKQVRVQLDPFHLRGTPARSFASGSRFSKQSLWHVEILFNKPVKGPLILGDGRFCGLGLMVPILDKPCDVLAFTLASRNRPSKNDAPDLIRALRAALMSLDRDHSHSHRPTRLFSGHGPDGAPDRSGHHEHVFLAADSGNRGGNLIERLIVAAPWAADRNVKQQNQAYFELVVSSLETLYAGRLGKFHLSTLETLADGDPLIGPALSWSSKSPYIATRNLKKHQDVVSMIKADVFTECKRRGFPHPEEIKIIDASVGPRGGRPTALMQIHFSVAIRGPLLIGRDSHKGNGLFHFEA